MSAAVILPNPNMNNRNIRRSEKFFKKFQQEIELSNSRLSDNINNTTRSSSRLTQPNDTVLTPILKTHRSKTPTISFSQIDNKPQKQQHKYRVSPVSTPDTLSTPNINNTHGGLSSSFSSRNSNTSNETIKNIKLNRSSSTVTTSGLKSASSASTTIFLKSKQQQIDDKKVPQLKSSHLATSSNTQLTSSSSLLFGFKMHKPKPNSTNDDLFIKKVPLNKNISSEFIDVNENRPILSKSLTNKIENAKKNGNSFHKKSSQVLSTNKNNLFSLNSKYTSLIRQKQYNKLQTVSTILE
jgi:hypothetical protein